MSFECSVTASIAKYAHETTASVAASPSMLSRRLKAFVMPTSQSEPDCPGDDVVADDLDGQAARDHDHGGDDLRCELRHDAQMPEIVDEPCEEHDGDAGDDAAELSAPVDRAAGEREGEPGDEAGEDADAAERRGLPLVPTVVARDGQQATARARAEEKPENRGGNAERRDRHDRHHNRERVVEQAADPGELGRTDSVSPKERRIDAMQRPRSPRYVRVSGLPASSPRADRRHFGDEAGPAKLS